jgi:transcriptional regulator with XRE-family HTH domain
MAMNLFEELLKEARKRARLSQQALADKVGVDDSYISKMENGVDKRPSREKAVKLADALGLRKKSRRRLEFLLAAGVTSEEDLEGFKLVEEENDQVLKTGTQAKPTRIPTTVNPSLSQWDSLLDTTYEQIEDIIEFKHFNEEEMERFASGLIEAAELLSKMIKPQHEKREED